MQYGAWTSSIFCGFGRDVFENWLNWTRLPLPFNRMKGFHNANTSILKKKTFKLVHKHPELEHKPIVIFQCVLSVNNPYHKSGYYCFGCILGLFSNKYSSCQITSMRLWLELHWWKTGTSSQVEASCCTWRTITFSLIRCELGPQKNIQWRPIKESLHQFRSCTKMWSIYWWGWLC